MILAVLEPETGVENLWKKGPSDGLRDYADFGQYIPKNYFKCFQAAAPFMWADEKLWFVSHRKTLPWEIFLPMVKAFNDQRTELMKVSISS
jgi:hypothetical protein